MYASLVIGIELFGFAIIAPISLGLRHGSLLLMVAGLWNIFIGVRIWKRVRSCSKSSTEHQPAHETPVDGALLFTYAFACTVLFASLCISPYSISMVSAFDVSFWLVILCLIVWSTILLFGAVLVLRRFCQWKTQLSSDLITDQQITSLVPPRWLLGVVFLVPTALAANNTYLAMIQDVRPLYVPFGVDAITATRLQILGTSLMAMDFVVLAILPLSYLYRRIPRIPWGVGFGVLGLMSLFHIGFFTKNFIATPRISVQPTFARAPISEVRPGHFVFSTPKRNEIKSGALESSYMGKQTLTHIRFISSATILLEYGELSASLNIPYDANGHMALTGEIVMVQVAPANFEVGIPTRLDVSLAIIDMHNRQSRINGVQLDLPKLLTPDEWRSQFELPELAVERSMLLGETVDLGSIQGTKVKLTLKPKL